MGFTWKSLSLAVDPQGVIENNVNPGLIGLKAKNAIRALDPRKGESKGEVLSVVRARLALQVFCVRNTGGSRGHCPQRGSVLVCRGGVPLHKCLTQGAKVDPANHNDLTQVQYKWLYH